MLSTLLRLTPWLTRRERARGTLLGLAVGDALGAPLEWQRPDQAPPVTGMRGGGPHGLPPGYWTDDTSMALCLGTSLVERRHSDVRDQMVRYGRWLYEGYLSSTGVGFGSGRTTREAIARFSRTGNPLAGTTDPRAAGNGSLMRVAPVALFYGPSYSRYGTRMAALSSEVTHAAPTCVDACRYFTGLLIGALRGIPRDELLGQIYAPFPGLWDEEPLDSAVAYVALGSYRDREPPLIRGTGYVVQSLEAALWAVHGARDFQDACLRAANLYEDADTTAALAGALAGALWGERGIPRAWLRTLHQRRLIERLADRLHRARPGARFAPPSDLDPDFAATSGRT